MISYIHMQINTFERVAFPLSKVEITMQDILWSLKKYFIWIVLTTVVAGAGMWFYTTNYVTPSYRCTMAFSIRASSRTGIGLTAGEQTADARLAALYCDLLRSDIVSEAVSDEMDGFLIPDIIKGMVSASAVDDSPVLNIYITGTDPDTVYQVAQAFAASAPDVLPELAGAGELYLINTPRPNYVPISPNVSSNTTMGILIGLFVSCAIVILIAVLDTTVWREEDLERAFDVPVLGSVPSMMGTNAEKSKKRRNS